MARATASPRLPDIVVSAIDSRDFQVNFGDNSGGDPTKYLSVNLAGFTSVTSGYLPTLTISNMRDAGDHHLRSG